MSADWWNESGLTLSARERLSALADGEVHSDEVARVMGAMSTDVRVHADVCETWHTYQLIGDVMRSEDLAPSSRDDIFLARLRERLAQEPVVLAPEPPRHEPAWTDPPLVAAAGAAPATVRRRWATPLTAAAGVMAVAGVLVGIRLAEAPQLAAPVPAMLAQDASAVAVQRVAVQPPSAAASEQAVQPASGTLLRDARLDRYLAAHKQFGGSSALGVPSGFLRSATYEGPSR